MSNNASKPDRLLTTAEAAALGPVCVRTIRNYATRGTLPVAVVLPSGHRRYRHDDVLALFRTAAERGA